MGYSILALVILSIIGFVVFDQRRMSKNIKSKHGHNNKATDTVSHKKNYDNIASTDVNNIKKEDNRLLNKLNNSSCSYDERKSIIEKLCEIADPAHLEILIAQPMKLRTADYHWAVEQIANKFGGQATTLLSLFLAANKRVSTQTVLDILKSIGDDSTYLTALIKINPQILEDGEWSFYVVPKLCSLLKKMGGNAIEPLIKCLGDSDERARFFAAQKLSECGDARAIAPMQKIINNNKSNGMYDISDFLEKLEERASQQLQVDQIKNDAAIDSETSEQNELHCDICRNITVVNQGYALTTPEVLLTTEYWHMVSHRHSEVCHNHNSLNMFLLPLALEESAWLVCEKCSELFKFDQSLARQYAIDGGKHPKARRLTLKETSKVLAYAQIETGLTDSTSMDAIMASKILLDTMKKAGVTA